MYNQFIFICLHLIKLRYQNLYTIYEGTVKSLVPLVQRVLLTSIYKKKYDQLTESEKKHNYNKILILSFLIKNKE